MSLIESHSKIGPKAFERKISIDDFISSILSAPIKLTDRREFNTSRIGSLIKTKAVIAGESKHKVLPRTFIVKCALCGLDEEVSLIDLASDSPEAIAEYLSKDIKSLKSRVMMHACFYSQQRYRASPKRGERSFSLTWRMVNQR